MALVLLLLMVVSALLFGLSTAESSERALPFQDITSAESNSAYHTRGWVPKELLSEKQADKLVPKVCKGAYLPYINEDSEVKPGYLYITGDKSTITESEKIELSGNIKAYVTDAQLFADRAQVDKKNGIVKADGRVRFFRQNLIFFGESFWFNSKTGEMKMDGVDFVKTDSRQSFQVAILSRDIHGVYRLEHSRYSTCEPGSNAWNIYGSTIDLDYKEGWGTITHAIAYIGDVPVFYFPWFQFPLDKRRHTGLLLPELSFSVNSGLYYRQPVYLNLAPNFDITLLPAYYGKRGLLAEAEVRLLTKHTTNTVIASGMNDALAGHWRSRKSIYHTGGINLPFRTRIDYTEVSDPLYFEDLHESITGSNSKFVNQSIDISGNYQPFSFRFGSYDTKPVGDESSTKYAKTPEGQITYKNKFGPLLVDLTSVYSNFMPRRLIDFTTTEIDNGDKGSATRIHSQAKLGLAFERSFGFVRSQLIFYNTSYEQVNQKAGNADKLERSIRTAVFDMGLLFDRAITFDQADYQQTLEPRLFAVQSGYIDQHEYPAFDTTEPQFTYDSLFRINRFHGYDRIGDTRSISYSLTSRLKDSRGYEFFKLGIGQIYYDKPRLVTIKADDTKTLASDKYQQTLSPIAMRMLITLSDRMRLNNDYTFNLNRQSSDMNRWNFQHRWNSRTVYNLGYNYFYDGVESETKREQIYVSGVVQTTVNWALLGRHSYDIKKDYVSEMLAGLEYESCCWRFRIGAFTKNSQKNDQNPNTGIFLQFYFKSLSGVSTTIGGSYAGNLDKKLGQAIPGFSYRQLYLPD